MAVKIQLISAFVNRKMNIPVELFLNKSEQTGKSLITINN